MNFAAPQPQQGLQMPQVIQNSIDNIGNSFNEFRDNVSNTVSGFSTQPGASTGFSYSNTIVAKVAFLILVVIIFMFLMNLGISLIGYFTSPTSNPYLIKGQIDGTSSVTIPQDPKNTSSNLVLRSNNQTKGLEFTWSVWLYINDLGTDATKYQHIFNKGDLPPSTGNNVSLVNNAPGIYLGPANNNLHIIMNGSDANTHNNIIDISNVPLKKWVHVAIRMQNTIMDVYVNGTISSRLVMTSVPKQNYNDVYVCQNGGFSGKLSNLRYYSSALNVFEINSIVAYGPNTSTNNLTADQSALGNYSYLSNLWYTAKL